MPAGEGEPVRNPDVSDIIKAETAKIFDLDEITAAEEGSGVDAPFGILS